jgi:hypothetical protein
LNLLAAAIVERAEESRQTPDGVIMRARALVVIAALPIAIASVPATAQAQRVTTRRCWSDSDWRSFEACNRAYDAEVAGAARREAAEERARLRQIDNADRAERARERRLESAAHAREVAQEARDRARERVLRDDERRREQVERAQERARERVRERQIERSFDRPIRLQRWP